MCRAAVLICLLLLSACTTPVDGTPIAVPRPTKPKPPPEFMLVTPTGDDQVTKLAVKGVEEYLKNKKGKLNRVTVSGQSSSDRTKVATAITRQKPQVVIAIGLLPDVMIQLLATNPQTDFLATDSCAGSRTRNLTCIEFRDYEGIYLLGAEAGLLTTTGKVGAVVSMDLPALKRFYVPFGQGAAAAKPGTTMTQLFLPQAENPFTNPVAAEAAAKQLGASHVMAVAFGGNKGVFKAAKDGGFSAFGMDFNECPNGLGAVADSTVKRTDIAVLDGLKAIEEKAGGATKSYGVKENVITLASLDPEADSAQCTVKTNPEVLNKVRELRDRIVSGELKVEDPGTR